MERFREYRPKQIAFIQFDPVQHFGKDSFECFLVHTIGTLDLAGFWSNDDKGGEPPYDPRAMLGIILYGFCRGIFSSRKLENACRNDLGFQYVSGFNTPDHAAICRFIQDHQKMVREVFRQIVYIADSSGFIDYRTLALDGTKIRANVSKDFTGTISDFRKRLASLDKAIGEAMERLRQPEDGDEASPTRRLCRLQDRKRRIEAFLDQAQELKNSEGKEKAQNATDPESRMMKFPSGLFLAGYNAQACVDSKSGLIVGELVCQAEADRGLLNPVLDMVKGLPESPPEPVKVLADSGYWGSEQLSQAAERGVDAYIPDPYQNYHKSHETPRLIDVYHQGADLMAKCSGGKVIKAGKQKVYKDKSKGDVVRIFTTSKTETCLGCSLNSQCFPGLKARKEFSMSVSKAENFDVLKKLAERMGSKRGRALYNQRMPLMERTFAETKAVLGFQRFLRRGLVRVQSEWTLVCSAVNLRRLHAAQRMA